MKTYNYKKAKQVIENNKDKIKEASLGMKEDWYWTAETIYSDGEFKKNLDDNDLLLGGIDGSGWATPALLVEYKDGKEIFIDMYIDDGSPEKHGFRMPFGPLSGPAQNSISDIKTVSEDFLLPEEKGEL